MSVSRESSAATHQRYGILMSGIAPLSSCRQPDGTPGYRCRRAGSICRFQAPDL